MSDYVPEMYKRWGLPSGEIDMVGFFSLMEEKDKEPVPLHLWFSQVELDNMCDLERLRNCNIYRNYQMMSELGLNPSKPLFMDRKKKVVKESSSESDSDEEWGQSRKRKRKAVTSSILKKFKVPKGRPLKARRKSRPKRSLLDKKVSWTYVDDDNEPFEYFSDAEIKATAKYVKEQKKLFARVLNMVNKGRMKLETAKKLVRCTLDFDDPNDDLPDIDPYPAWANESRYPRRNIARKSYVEVEDDHFLYCEDCRQEYMGHCPVHGPVVVVEDVDAEELEGTDAYAASTAPFNLEVEESTIPGAGFGTFTTDMAIPENVQMGPYKGKVVKITSGASDAARDNGYSWQISDEADRVTHLIDASDPAFSNWMRYVNCARNEEEQNLLAYQYAGEVYYRSTKPIPLNTELLVFYGSEYGKMLGIEEDEEKQKVPEVEEKAAVPIKQDERVPYSKLHGKLVHAVQTMFPVAQPKGFPCDVCGVCFTTELFMQQHRVYQHPELKRSGKERYKCGQCQYTTNDKSDYTKHLLTHSGEKPHSCEVCGKQFSQKSNLTVHQRIHTGEKPYGCSVCGKHFNQTAILKRHERSHSKEDGFHCQFCDKVFSHKHHLSTHIRTHTGEKQLQCGYCDYRCNQHSDLKKHVISQHTHEFPHCCELCGKGFMRPNLLKKHIMNTHSGSK